MTESAAITVPLGVSPVPSAFLRIEKTTEIFTYADYPVPFTIFEVFGFGKPMEHRSIMELPGVQAGMNSAGYRGLWLGNQELRIRHFHKVLDDYLYPDGKPDGAY